MSALSAWQQAMHALTSTGAPFETAEAEGVARFIHAPATLNAALEQGRRHGALDFTLWQDQRLSFDDYFLAVDQVAAALLARGIGRGSHVAIAMRNRPEWLIAFHAILKTGAVAVALNSWWQKDELSAALADSGAGWLIADADRLQRLAGQLEHIGVIGVDHAAPLDFSELTAPLPTVWPHVNPTDPAAILFTSGTSARAKGVQLSQGALAQAVFTLDFFAAIGAMVQPEIVARVAGRRLKNLLAVPLFHVSGLVAQFFAGLRGGRLLVMMHRWDAGQALQLIASEAITNFNGSPAMQVDLLNHPDFSADKLAGVIGLGYGGAAVPPTLSHELGSKVPHAIQGSGYGMTESCGIGCVISGSLFAQNPEATGLSSPVVRLRVVDTLGNPLPFGMEGEVQLSGVTLMDGYVQDGQLQRSAFDGIWFASGDIGHLSADGLLTLTGRNKEVINRGGEKIALAEVENCLVAHPDVLEAAAFPVADARLGERLEAWVVMKPGAAFDAGAIHDFAANRLAAYKLPAAIRQHHAALPRNATGKLLRRELDQARTA